MKREIVAVVTLILAFVIAGLALHTFLPDQPRAPLVFSVVAPALITFFWFLTWMSIFDETVTNWVEARRNCVKTGEGGA